MRSSIVLFLLISLINFSNNQASNSSIPIMNIAHEVVKALHLNPHPDSLEQLLSENIQFYAKTDEITISIHGREELIRNLNEKYIYDTEHLSSQEVYYNCSIDEVYYKSVADNIIGLYIKWNMQNQGSDLQTIDDENRYKLETLVTLIFKEDPNAKYGYSICQFDSEYSKIPLN